MAEAGSTEPGRDLLSLKALALQDGLGAGAQGEKCRHLELIKLVVTVNTLYSTSALKGGMTGKTNYRNENYE